MTRLDTLRVIVNQTFEKIWELHNAGDIPWDNRKLVCIDNALQAVRNGADFDPSASRRYILPSSNSINIPRTLPGESVKLSVRFAAPPYPGSQISNWKMTYENGEICYPKQEGLWCLVRAVAI